MSVKGEIYVLCVCVFVFSFIYCWVFISCLVSWNKCTSCEVLDPLLSIQKQCVFWNWAHSKMRIFIINLHCFPFPSKITFPLSFSFFLSLNSLYFYVNIFFFFSAARGPSVSFLTSCSLCTWRKSYYLSYPLLQSSFHFPPFWIFFFPCTFNFIP